MLEHYASLLLLLILYISWIPEQTELWHLGKNTRAMSEKSLHTQKCSLWASEKKTLNEEHYKEIIKDFWGVD